MSNPERGAPSMVESMLRTLGFAVSAIGLSVFAVAGANATEVDADALAQKFIDGPAQEAREAPWYLSFTHGPLTSYTLHYKDGSSRSVYYFTFKVKNASKKTMATIGTLSGLATIR